jgi:hypothetical protein
MQNPQDTPPEPPAARKAVRVKTTLCRRVREALLSLGGEAHRSMVIEHVARTMGHDVRQIPEELQLEVIVSFEATWRDARKRAAFGFHLPFGEGSHRWGVIDPELAYAA